MATKKIRPRDYKEHFIASVVKRSGICRATVEQVMPAVFDELRYQLSEGYGFVPIESFGTFIVQDIPARRHQYNYKSETPQYRILPATQRLKFYPTKNLRREVLELHQYDHTRRSFVHDPHDPPMKRRKELRYHPLKPGQQISKGPTERITDSDDE